MKLRIHGGQKQAEIVQQFQSMALIISSAFGSEKGGGSGGSQNLKPATTVQDVKAGFARVFG